MSGDIVVSDDRVEAMIDFDTLYEGWVEASCEWCDWTTTGTESTVEDAAYEHVATMHPPEPAEP
ncbi:hypothetical protein SEA_SKOG_78 [Gordonia phage Skog]|uniref:Uncharacterized protein n=1 Tax=Gordonia phage Skog TaxID=2704033 RepID=A0A6G6XKD9_9CAUD|nr:hypothetical protein KHQ85_gp078 [Gordonia phage Skog]QIG58230.1 hypothetical protein SEA_SKOG_78 [Gordonia phage Skog]